MAYPAMSGGAPPGTRWLKQQTAKAKRQKAAPNPYALGVVKGKLHTLPKYDHLYRDVPGVGRVRPFGPGEWLDRSTPDNPDNWSSEESNTVDLNGQKAVVPGLWLVNGVPTMVDEDTSARYAQASGLHWPMFPTDHAADAWATNRENIWEQTPIGRSDAQSPLWSYTPQQPTAGTGG